MVTTRELHAFLMKHGKGEFFELTKWAVSEGYFVWIDTPHANVTVIRFVW